MNKCAITSPPLQAPTPSHDRHRHEQQHLDLRFHYVLTHLLAFAAPGAAPVAGDDAGALRWATTAQVREAAMRRAKEEGGSAGRDRADDASTAAAPMMRISGDVARLLERAELLLDCGALDEASAIEVPVAPPPYATIADPSLL